MDTFEPEKLQRLILLASLDDETEELLKYLDGLVVRKSRPGSDTIRSRFQHSDLTIEKTESTDYYSSHPDFTYTITNSFTNFELKIKKNFIAGKYVVNFPLVKRDIAEMIKFSD